MNTEYLILNNNKKKEQDNKPLDSYHYGAGLKVQRIWDSKWENKEIKNMRFKMRE